MQDELKTVLVSVNVDDSDETRLEKINARVGQGWEVVQHIPLSGGGTGPGGESEDFLRLQVTLRRTIDEDGVIQNADRTGASELQTQPATAAFDPPSDSIDESPDAE